MRYPSWARTAALLLITFAAGTMAGVAYERHARAPLVATIANPRQFVDHITQALGLDSAQKAAVAQILARHQGAVDSAWRAMQPHVGATLDSVHREMMTVLTPAQQKHFLSIMHGMH
jgi:hypothetical protein